jgi:hypothetical protein
MRLVAPCAALLLLAVLQRSAVAQDAYHWSRYHAEPPLSEILPEALSAPPSPVESGALGERPTRDLVDNLDGSYSYDETGFSAHVDGEGRVRIKDKSGVQAHVLITPLFLAVYGTFDATDILMRWVGEDPYQYQKMMFLERTFEERARMRERYARKNMKRAIRELPDYLSRIWSYDPWPPDLRRRVLFALWDECAEEGNSLMVAGGAQARAVIEDFVRENLGPGSPDAFRAEEIARLNELRTSSAAFAPYAGSRPAPALLADSAPPPSAE